MGSFNEKISLFAFRFQRSQLNKDCLIIRFYFFKIYFTNEFVI